MNRVPRRYPKALALMTAGIIGMASFAIIYLPAFFAYRGQNIKPEGTLEIGLSVAGLFIGMHVFLHGLGVLLMLPPARLHAEPTSSHSKKVTN